MDERYLEEILRQRIQSITDCTATGSGALSCESPAITDRPNEPDPNDPEQDRFNRPDLAAVTIDCTDVVQNQSAQCSFAEPALGDAVVSIACSSDANNAAECSLNLPNTPAQSGLIENLQSIPGTNTNADEIGRIVGTLCPPPTDNRERLQNRLQQDCTDLVLETNNGSDDSDVGAALTEVAPNDASAPTDAALSSINAQNNNIGSRLRALRHGVTSVGLSGVRNTDPLIASSSQNRTIKRIGGGAAGDDAIDFGRLGFFVNGTVSTGEKDRTANEDGYDLSTSGLSAGLDFRFSDAVVAGIAAGVQSTHTDLINDGGHLDAQGLSITLYGSYVPNDNLWVDASLTAGSNDFDQKRRIRYTLNEHTGGLVVDQTARADFDGYQINASIGGGYEFNDGAMSYGPTFRAQYARIHVDGYEERMSDPDPATPGSGWPVKLASQDFDSFTATLGIQGRYAMSFDWGVLQPFAGIEMTHEFNADTDPIYGRFLFDPNEQVFRIETDDLDENYFNLSLGTSAVFSDGKSAYIQLQSLLGYDDVDHTSINGGFRLEF